MMNLNNFYNEVISLASAAPAEEICGFLLLNSFHSLEVYPSRNIALNRENSWEINFQEQIQFHRTNSVFGLYHSHVRDTEEFSEQDKRTADNAEVPILVYSLKTRRFNYYRPKVCIPEYVGRNFILGVQDCMQIVIDYYEKELGVVLPFMLRTPEIVTSGLPDWGHYAEVAGLELVDDEPKPNDIMVMSIKGDRSHINHVSICTEPGMMLHQLWGEKSCYQMITSSWLSRLQFCARPKTLPVKF